MFGTTKRIFYYIIISLNKLKSYSTLSHILLFFSITNADNKLKPNYNPVLINQINLKRE